MFLIPSLLSILISLTLGSFVNSFPSSAVTINYKMRNVLSVCITHALYVENVIEDTMHTIQ